MTHPATHSLGCYMNLGSLPASDRASDASFHAIREAGYDGVQFGDFPHPDRVHAAQALGLGVCGSGRVNAPAEASLLAQKAVESGFECLTVHVGWGMEDDPQADQTWSHPSLKLLASIASRSMLKPTAPPSFRTSGARFS